MPNLSRHEIGAVDVDHLYEGSSYLQAYSKHTDMRVSVDPKDAVGGLWEEVGKLQVDF